MDIYVQQFAFHALHTNKYKLSSIIRGGHNLIIN